MFRDDEAIHIEEQGQRLAHMWSFAFWPIPPSFGFGNKQSTPRRIKIEGSGGNALKRLDLFSKMYQVETRSPGYWDLPSHGLYSQSTYNAILTTGRMKWYSPSNAYWIEYMHGGVKYELGIRIDGGIYHSTRYAPKVDSPLQIIYK